jgi:hypothetical protein
MRVGGEAGDPILLVSDGRVAQRAADPVPLIPDKRVLPRPMTYTLTVYCVFDTEAADQSGLRTHSGPSEARKPASEGLPWAKTRRRAPAITGVSKRELARDFCIGSPQPLLMPGLRPGTFAASPR